MQIFISEFALPKVGLLRDNKQSTPRKDDAFAAMKEELKNAQQLRNYRNRPNFHAQEVSCHHTKRENEDEAPSQEEPTVVPKMSLGCKSLAEIRAKKAIYVDRTKLVYNIITDPRTHISIFMRPHRFGKTLLLDVFETILRHNEEDLKLLRGTYVENLAQQLPTYTVLRFNFQDLRTIEDFDAELMRYALSYGILKDIESFLEGARKERTYYQQQVEGITVHNLEPIAIFPFLIHLLKKPVAVLVDDYSIIFNSKNETIREYFIKFFQSFKGLSELNQLDFAFITGCDKVKMNRKEYYLTEPTLGIEDISSETKFAHILGFTEIEIRKYYHRLAQVKAEACNNKPIEKIYKQMKFQYNGYQFGDNHSPLVYNPVSVMKYLMDKENFEGDNYWVNTVPDSAKIEHIIIENHLLDLNKDIINLHSYLTERELFNEETILSLENKSHKYGMEALLYRHGYLTTAAVGAFDGIFRENCRSLRFSNNEALEAFQQAVTNVIAKTKEGTELSKIAWKNINKEVVDVDGFAKAFNDFIKFQACQFMMRQYISRNLESFFKHFVEAIMKEAKCDGCNVYREKTLSESTEEDENIKRLRPDFIFDTQDKRIYIEFKYENDEINFRGKCFNQLKGYKFHACKYPHPKGEKARKIKILINLDSNGNIAQWYGPKEYKFNTKAEDWKLTKEAEDQELATETFEDNYLTTLQAFPKLPKPTVHH